MKFSLLVLAIILLLLVGGCGSPIGRGLQKTFHYATLGLVNDPAVSDEVKQDVVNHQADNAASLALEEMIRDTYKDYHRVALIAYVVGVGIIVLSLINIPVLAFLAKQSWKVGGGIVLSAGVLSVFATIAVEERAVDTLLWGIKGAVALALIGCGYLIYKLIISIIKKRRAR